MTLETEIVAAWDRLTQGDQTAADILFEHFYPRLVNAIFLRPGYMPVEDVEDVKHDAAETVLGKVFARPELVKFTATDADERYRTLRVYLKGAAQNQALTLYKRRRRAFRTKVDEDEYYSISDDVGLRELERILTDNDRKAWLYQMISEHLTGAQQIVVHNRFFGLSFKEIAEDLGLSEKAAQDRHRRAVAKLRRLAERHFKRNA